MEHVPNIGDWKEGNVIGDWILETSHVRQVAVINCCHHWQGEHHVFAMKSRHHMVWGKISLCQMHGKPRRGLAKEPKGEF